MKHQQKSTIIILGIIAVLAIAGIVILFNGALSGKVVKGYTPIGMPVKYPTSLARSNCVLPEPRLDLTKEECQMIAWADCAQMYGNTVKVSTCQTICGQEVSNICRKASGDYGLGLTYVYEERLGLRRPVND